MATGMVLFHLKGNGSAEKLFTLTGVDNYPAYLIIGTALYGSTSGILLNVSRTLMTERREGTLESVLLAPFLRWQYYGGNQLHQLFLSGIDLLLASILGMFLKVHFHIHLIGLLLSLIQFFITLYGLALLISLLMIILRDTYFIQNTIMPLVLLTGGYLFPPQVLPSPLQLISFLIPVHYGTSGVRESVLSGTASFLNKDFTYSFLPGLIMLAAGYCLLPLIERKAVEELLS